MEGTGEAQVRARDDETVLKATMKQFGGVRAEYFKVDELSRHFSTPNYWPELITPRPCFLVGGRGTGKTTALRGLSYRGQFDLGETPFNDWEFIGLYWRIDTNVVSAFAGAPRGVAEWSKLFAHYVNLRSTQLIVEYFAWRENIPEVEEDPSQYDPRLFTDVCESLHLEPASDFTGMLRSIRVALLRFEARVNNIDAESNVPLSLLGAPLRVMFEYLAQSGHADKTFYYLVDEFENLQDYQQRVFNTLIKHAGDANYTFKIGVKTTGRRDVRTLNDSESLSEPADFVTIDIVERLKELDFAQFAGDICDKRLAMAAQDAQLETHLDVKALFPPVSLAEEARLLGADEVKRRVILQALTDEVDGDLIESLKSASSYQVALLDYWTKTSQQSLAEVISSWRADPETWVNRLNNHGVAMLFTLSGTGRDVRKYYCGWETMLRMADGNIRFLLQLVGEALFKHIFDGFSLDRPVSPKLQTDAAAEVGKRAIEQLPGSAKEGAEVTRLVLGLGRVFQVLASTSGGAPEVSQFRVTNPSEAEVKLLLDSGVMHLALLRFPGNKRARGSAETRDYDYRLHPIFAAYFVFSHRSKRRLIIDNKDFLAMTRGESSGVDRVLKRHGGDLTHTETAPRGQLDLFDGVFGEARA